MRVNGEWLHQMDLTLEVSMFMVFITSIINTLFFYFIDTIWVILSVAEGGTLALTQQLTHFNALGSVIPLSSPYNPFAAQNVGRPQHLHQVYFIL